MPVLLVTGFGPFRNVTRNPSGVAAQTVHGREIDGTQIIGTELVVSWQSAWETTLRLVEEHQPQVLLCLGVANWPNIELEQVARNVIGPEADVEGVVLQSGAEVVPGGRATLSSALPLDWLKKRIAERALAQAVFRNGTSIVSQFSDNAGDYLCNFLFYNVMHHLEGRVPHRGFIHVPPYDESGENEAEVDEVLIYLVEELAHWLVQNAESASGEHSWSI